MHLLAYQYVTVKQLTDDCSGLALLGSCLWWPSQSEVLIQLLLLWWENGVLFHEVSWPNWSELHVS